MLVSWVTPKGHISPIKCKPLSKYVKYIVLNKYFLKLSHFNATSSSRSPNCTSRLTWKSHLQVLLHKIRESDFVTFDVEYTGLHVKDERFIGVSKCYQAHSVGAKTFMPCQLGLTSAKFNPDTNAWEITPSSIYIYPSQDRNFQVSTTALNFLRDNNFDFNQWVNHGIGHLTPMQENEKKNSILSRINELEQLKQNSTKSVDKTPTSFDLSSIPDEKDRVVAVAVIKQVEEWIQNDDPKPLEISMDSAFQRLLMHTIIGHEFPTVFSHSIKREDQRMLCVYRSQDEVYREQMNGLQLELDNLAEQVGIRTLLDCIAECNKIVVGHNCFYDILHIYQYFYGDLPESIDEFKRIWIKKFAQTFDTKYISECHPTLSSLQLPSTLKGLFEYMCAVESSQKDKTKLQINTLPNTKWIYPVCMRGLMDTVCHSVDDLEDKSHDAGYDSLMTCIIFILQSNYILREQNSQTTKLSSIGDTMSLALNRIRLVKTQPNMIYLNGSETDTVRHFYMCNFPSNWKKWEIMKAFSPVWISIHWINETSCWIVARNDEDVRNISLIYKMQKNPPYSLLTYEEYSQSVKPNGDG
ncbi:CAF1 family ribonuclease [Babesia microti strain RI]|uniref:CAF1 family ribonuclease n=1 Tax=Babesia microti (strain RI) TaxID=1133968 RepID=A0A1R4ABN1_BABMR|nr:CAF1 family ribonuclease [Babesia microti strain RI]SJK86398.1 CAF1 family ribonuclease [Babesia microti strain RI]|eukprot:XP_021338559.1 CAF1 family ribonuclease [Babesia microti strain RI]